MLLDDRPCAGLDRTTRLQLRAVSDPCHQMYFAASAMRMTATMTTAAICSQKLLARPLLLSACLSICNHLLRCHCSKVNRLSFFRKMRRSNFAAGASWQAYTEKSR